MQVFHRERLNGHYGVVVYILSNFLSSFPFLVAVTIASGTITWLMVKFRPEFSHYLFYCLNLFGSISVVESCMMVVASVVPNFLMGLVTGAGIIVRINFFKIISILFEVYNCSNCTYHHGWTSAGNIYDDLWILPLVT